MQTPSSHPPGAAHRPRRPAPVPRPQTPASAPEAPSRPIMFGTDLPVPLNSGTSRRRAFSRHGRRAAPRPLRRARGVGGAATPTPVRHAGTRAPTTASTADRRRHRGPTQPASEHGRSAPAVCTVGHTACAWSAPAVCTSTPSARPEKETNAAAAASPGRAPSCAQPSNGSDAWWSSADLDLDAGRGFGGGMGGPSLRAGSPGPGMTNGPPTRSSSATRGTRSRRPTRQTRRPSPPPVARSRRASS